MSAEVASDRVLNVPNMLTSARLVLSIAVFMLINAGNFFAATNSARASSGVFPFMSASVCAKKFDIRIG